MSDLSYKILEKRQKVHIRTYAVLCLILIASMGTYIWQNWQKYAAYKEGVSQNEIMVDALRSEVKTEKADFDKSKDGFDSLSSEIAKRLAIVFPSGDDYTNITRMIDDFERTMATKNNPFEVSNITYHDVIEGEDYSIQPFRMNIRSSSENFTEFLHFIENSGALDSDTRLMDISSVRLSFENSSDLDDGPEMINFSVQINAYFQK